MYQTTIFFGRLHFVPLPYKLSDICFVLCNNFNDVLYKYNKSKNDDVDIKEIISIDYLNQLINEIDLLVDNNNNNNNNDSEKIGDEEDDFETIKTKDSEIDQNLNEVRDMIYTLRHDKEDRSNRKCLIM